MHSYCWTCDFQGPLGARGAVGCPLAAMQVKQFPTNANNTITTFARTDMPQPLGLPSTKSAPQKCHSLAPSCSGSVCITAWGKQQVGGLKYSMEMACTHRDIPRGSTHSKTAHGDGMEGAKLGLGPTTIIFVSPWRLFCKTNTPHMSAMPPI